MLEGKVVLVSCILQLSPDFPGKVFAQKTLSARWEHWESVKIVRSFQVRANLDVLLWSFLLSLFELVLVLLSTLMV